MEDMITCKDGNATSETDYTAEEAADERERKRRIEEAKKIRRASWCPDLRPPLDPKEPKKKETPIQASRRRKALKDAERRREAEEKEAMLRDSPGWESWDAHVSEEEAAAKKEYEEARRKMNREKKQQARMKLKAQREERETQNRLNQQKVQRFLDEQKKMSKNVSPSVRNKRKFDTVVTRGRSSSMSLWDTSDSSDQKNGDEAKQNTKVLRIFSAHQSDEDHLGIHQESSGTDTGATFIGSASGQALNNSIIYDTDDDSRGETSSSDDDIYSYTSSSEGDDDASYPESKASRNAKIEEIMQRQRNSLANSWINGCAVAFYKDDTTELQRNVCQNCKEVPASAAVIECHTCNIALCNACDKVQHRFKPFCERVGIVARQDNLHEGGDIAEKTTLFYGQRLNVHQSVNQISGQVVDLGEKRFIPYETIPCSHCSRYGVTYLSNKLDGRKMDLIGVTGIVTLHAADFKCKHCSTVAKHNDPHTWKKLYIPGSSSRVSTIYTKDLLDTIRLRREVNPKVTSTTEILMLNRMTEKYRDDKKTINKRSFTQAKREDTRRNNDFAEFVFNYCAWECPFANEDKDGFRHEPVICYDGNFKCKCYLKPGGEKLGSTGSYYKGTQSVHVDHNRLVEAHNELYANGESEVTLCGDNFKCNKAGTKAACKRYVVGGTFISCCTHGVLMGLIAIPPSIREPASLHYLMTERVIKRKVKAQAYSADNMCQVEGFLLRSLEKHPITGQPSDFVSSFVGVIPATHVAMHKNECRVERDITIHTHLGAKNGEEIESGPNRLFSAASSASKYKNLSNFLDSQVELGISMNSRIQETGPVILRQSLDRYVKRLYALVKRYKERLAFYGCTDSLVVEQVEAPKPQKKVTGKIMTIGNSYRELVALQHLLDVYEQNKELIDMATSKSDKEKALVLLCGDTYAAFRKATQEVWKDFSPATASNRIKRLTSDICDRLGVTLDKDEMFEQALESAACELLGEWHEKIANAYVGKLRFLKEHLKGGKSTENSKSGNLTYRTLRKTNNSITKMAEEFNEIRRLIPDKATDFGAISKDELHALRITEAPGSDDKERAITIGAVSISKSVGPIDELIMLRYRILSLQTQIFDISAKESHGLKIFWESRLKCLRKRRCDIRVPPDIVLGRYFPTKLDRAGYLSLLTQEISRVEAISEEIKKYEEYRLCVMDKQRHMNDPLARIISKGGDKQGT